MSQQAEPAVPQLAVTSAAIQSAKPDAGAIRTERAIEPTSKPAFNPDGIPAELKALPQWVVWKYEVTDTSGGRPTKVPYNARTGGRSPSQ